MSELMYKHKINSNSVVQQVLDQITEWIIDGQLRPGDKIPTEDELSTQFGISRNSVREAIKIMVYLGILEIKRSEGTYVCSGASHNMLNPMLYSIILNGSNSRRDIMEIREMIETGVVGLAIRKGEEGDLALLSEKLDVLQQKIHDVSPIEDVFQADIDFHKAIVSMDHNILAESINDIVSVLTYGIRHRTVEHLMTTATLREKFYTAHRDLYDLIRTKNSKKEDIGEIVRGSYNLPYLESAWE